MRHTPLLIILFIICFCSRVHAAITQKQITDLALIYGNVKYYYPSRSIKEADWARLCAYTIKAWEADSGKEKQDDQLYKDIEQKYNDMGLQISLYTKPPSLKTDSAFFLQGKHWEYEGYPFSKTRFQVGAFMAPIYNLFLNPYHRRFKNNSLEYLQALKQSGQLYLTDKQWIVKLNDNLWLGLPIKHNAQPRAEAFKSFMVQDENELSAKLTFIIEAWNNLYHFSPALVSREEWLIGFGEMYPNVMAGVTPRAAAGVLMAGTNDAHSNFVATYVLPGNFYKIEDSFYYREVQGDSIIKMWRVLQYDSEAPDKVYNEAMLRAISPNQNAKSWYALRRMAMPRDTTGIRLQVQDIITGSVFTSTVYGKFSNADPGSDHHNGKHRMIDDSLGIYYMDLKQVTEPQVKKIMKSKDCKAAILDIRGHPYLGTTFIRNLIDTICVFSKGVIPLYRFPDMNMVQYDTSYEYVKPGLKKITKPLVLLCDESSISYAENLLFTLRNGTTAVTIGRPTAGTTGNIVIAPVYYGNKDFDLTPFTAMIALNNDGSRFTGIKPDISVQQNLPDLVNRQDEIFNAGLKYLTNTLRK